jgi:hypothetical protein
MGVTVALECCHANRNHVRGERRCQQALIHVRVLC